MRGAPYGDKSQIIYVNGAYKVKACEDKTALMALIEDFHCANADDMNSKILADRMKQIKGSKEEMSNMCKEVEKFAEKKAREAAREATENEATRNILKLLKKNKTVAEVVDLLEYSLERVTKVARDNGFATV